MRQAAINFRLIDHGLVGCVSLLAPSFTLALSLYLIIDKIFDGHLSFAKRNASWNVGKWKTLLVPGKMRARACVCVSVNEGSIYNKFEYKLSNQLTKNIWHLQFAKSSNQQFVIRTCL